MRHYSQKKLLKEGKKGFTDIVRGVASATKAAAQTLAPELTQPLGRLAEPFKKTAQAYSSQQPLSVLKEYLKKNKSIEPIKFDKPVKQQANPKKSYFKRITGPKSVTIIPFTATVYHQQDQKYKTYGEAVGATPGVGNLSPMPVNNNTQPQQQPQQQPQGTNPAKPKIQTSNRPLTPNSNQQEPRKLLGEVFRTSQGLEVGDILDAESGEILLSNSGRVKRYTFDRILAHFWKDEGISPSPVLTPDQAQKLLRLVYNLNFELYDDSLFQTIKKHSPGGNIEVERIKQTLKSQKLVESTKVSQKVLLEQLISLTK